MVVIRVGSRLANDEQQFTDNAFSDKSLLLVQNGLPPESFSVELTVGESWSENYGALNNHMYEISAEGVEIPRNGSIVIEVAEDLRVPHNMYGIVVPTGSLFLDRGVIIAAAKVEPSFRGRLKLRLVNTTGKTVRLPKKRKVASIIFFATEITTFHAPVEKKAIRDEKPPGRVKTAKHWLAANHIQLIVAIIGLTGSAVMAALLVRYVLPPAPAAPAIPIPAPALPPAPDEERTAPADTGQPTAGPSGTGRSDPPADPR
jgi:dUTPase